jgi:hypothetical protein
MSAMRSSSQALIPTPTQEITFIRDVEMEDEEPETFSVPEFLAAAYKHTAEQLRAFASRLANAEEMARMSESDRAEIKKYYDQLVDNQRYIFDDCVKGLNENYKFSYTAYQWIERQCATFEEAVTAKFAVLSGSNEDLMRAVEKLSRGHADLYQAAEHSHIKLQAGLNSTTEALIKEKGRRKVIAEELSTEREARLRAASDAARNHEAYLAELRKVKDAQRQLAKGKKPEFSSAGNSRQDSEEPAATNPFGGLLSTPPRRPFRRASKSPTPPQLDSPRLLSPPVEVEELGHDKLVMRKADQKELLDQAVARALGEQTPPREKSQIMRLAKRHRRKDPETYDRKAETFRTWWMSRGWPGHKRSVCFN